MATNEIITCKTCGKPLGYISSFNPLNGEIEIKLIKPCEHVIERAHGLVENPPDVRLPLEELVDAVMGWDSEEEQQWDGTWLFDTDHED